MALNVVRLSAVVVLLAPLPGQLSAPLRTALIVDEKRSALVQIDANSGAELERLRLPEGRAADIFVPAESNRLVVLTDQLGRTDATIVERIPLRLVATESLGNACRLLARSRDGLRLTFECFGSVVTLNVATGRTASQAARGFLPGSSVSHLPPDRIALVSDLKSSWQVQFLDASTLEIIGETTFPGEHIHLRDGALTADGRQFVVRKDGAGKRPAASELLSFEVATGRLTRTIKLARAFTQHKLSRDGRFAYLSDVPFPSKNRGSTVEILSLADGEVVERISIGPGSSWEYERPPAQTPEKFIFDRADSPEARLLVFADRQVLSIPMPGVKDVTIIPDRERNRIFVAGGRKLSRYTLPRFEHAGDVALDMDIGDIFRFAANEDFSRVLWLRDGAVQLLDTQSLTSLPSAKIGTAGSKVKQFMGDLGASMLTGGGVSSAVDPKAVFANGGKRVFALASTGQLAILDMASGRVLEHRAGGGALAATPGLGLAVDHTTVRVWNRTTGAEVQTLQLDTRLREWPFVAQSSDGSRVIVGGGTAVYVLDGITGKTIAAATGFGRSAAGWVD